MTAAQITPKTKKTKRKWRPKLTPETVQEIFRRFAAAKPEPKGELEYVDAYTLLVAVVLSAQATDVGVNKVTRLLFKVADTPAKVVALGEDKLRDLIKSLGLFRNKAKHVMALSERLIAEHRGEVPRDTEALEKLPGVGRKTANVVMNVAFGQPTLAVDTHVFRVAHRVGFANGKTPAEVEQQLLTIVPPELRVHAHHWLILHGRYVCRARKPDCPTCLIRDLCTFSEKTVA